MIGSVVVLYNPTEDEIKNINSYIRIGITAFIMLITKALRHVEYPMHRVWE